MQHTNRLSLPQRPHNRHLIPAEEGVAAMPQALRDRLEAAGVDITDRIREAAAVLVSGKLTARTRVRYGWDLGKVAQWCDLHCLDLLRLSALDIAALAVASRDSGYDPDMTLTALSFLYRHKHDPDESATTVARRVDRVWKAQGSQATRERRVQMATDAR